MKRKTGSGKSFLFLTLVLAITLIPFSAWAAGYPQKPITLVAPYGPGGASDLASRTLATVAHAYIGQPVLVVNKTGASGAMGSSYVNKAKPDGYTLLLARVGCNAVLPALNPNLPYEWDGFTMLGLLELNPFVFVVHSDSSIKSFQELVAALKDKSKTLSYSTSGPGTILHFGPQVLFDQIGLGKDAATMLPYKGGGQAAAALLGKHVDFMGINLAPVLSHIQAGTLRALAVTTKERYSAIPNVPTVRELGYPALETIIGWSGLFGPPNMDKEAVDKWVAALQKIKKDKSWKTLTKKLGSIPYIIPPDETKAFVRKQYNTFHELAVKLDILVK
ncbi:MAG: tripartite tricarboxylate transporter substrate binding protein [Deltaproteobacteria bacterium]|nr:tripartite tricarboxylate transporter substrate binding protein [Deltaproteobacteria bacterium]MBW1961595.1 tripartite tricarboxylate transporter substrate binding protein [Deltaproteobacteria bacterium]MBW1994274.1 tripartite tricarboxylate transporter substrate binding protein [Deltaproteobacteria bacterium]MBW2152074.1 tripartite tricarboxylate transporter substrate binding protein [Deltaproteobacteria bacterium]